MLYTLHVKEKKRDALAYDINKFLQSLMHFWLADGSWFCFFPMSNKKFMLAILVIINNSKDETRVGMLFKEIILLLVYMSLIEL